MVTNEALRQLEDEVRGGRDEQIVAILGRAEAEGLGAAEISEILEYLQAEGWDLEDEYRRRCQVRCTLNTLSNDGLAYRVGRRTYTEDDQTRSEYTWGIR